MTSSVCVLVSCALMVAHGLADMDNNEQIEQIFNKMMAAKISEVEEKVEEMRVEKDREMEEMQEKVDVMREEMREKENKLKKQLDGLEARNTELTTKLREVDQKSPKDLPFILTCAYKKEWTASGTITYDRLTVDYNNSGRPGGGDGDMDISTGQFTALTPGHYTVTYSGTARADPGEYVIFQLMKNGVDVGDEGKWRSYSNSDNGDYIDDQGSRTVVSVYLCTDMDSLILTDNHVYFHTL